MMIEALTNRVIPIQETIGSELMLTKSFSIASSFIDREAINQIEHALLKNKGLKEARILIGVYGCFNRKANLGRLQSLAKKYAIKLQLRISRDRNFHWKYYHFTSIRKQAIYIGSANFTTGGMCANGELLVRLSDSLPEKEKGVKSLLQEFEKEWEASGSIAEFKIEEYHERPLSKSKAANGVVGNKDFFDVGKSKKNNSITTEKAILIYLTTPMSSKALKMVANAKSSWQDSEFMVCSSKAVFEQCISIKKLIIISRAGRDNFYAYSAIQADSLQLKTPDGSYFISYDFIGKEKKLSKKVLDQLTDKKYGWGFKLNGRVGILNTKVLGKNQVASLSEVLGIK